MHLLSWNAWGRALQLAAIGLTMAAAAVSGISHLIHRNIEWPLFWRLLIPGVIGGVLGA